MLEPKIEKILVPTDGSGASERAMPIAELIAGANKAEVVVVQVVPDLVITDDTESLSPVIYEEILDEETEAARAHTTRLLPRFEAAGVRARSQIVRGPAALSLLEVETREHPDLVIMASHGRTGVARAVLGSIADQLVREGTAPVIVVHGEPPESKLQSALLMLDGSRVAEAALPMVEALAGRPIQQLRLLRVTRDSDRLSAATAYLADVKERLQRPGLSIDTVAEVGNPVLIAQREAPSLDLVILATHGRSGFDRLRHGSVAAQVVRHIEQPVLLVRATAE